MRYRSFNRYLREKFGVRVDKITIDAGFSCPNRTGEKGRGGCIYCNNAGFSVNSRGRRPMVRSVREQIQEGIERRRKRNPTGKFLAYFQAYTNTYGPLEHLRRLYDEALSVPDVVGLAIGTRPDCAEDDVLDLLNEYGRRCELWLEYGLQSSHNRTLERINRGHDFACFVDALERTRKCSAIQIGVHVILGLPGETRKDILTTAERLGRLEFQGIKIHLLHVVRDTILEEHYRRGEIRLLEQREYVSLVVDFLERLPSSVTIHRLTGEAPPDVLIAPRWCLNKTVVLRSIHEEMERRDFRQGSRLA